MYGSSSRQSRSRLPVILRCMISDLPLDRRRSRYFPRRERHSTFWPTRSRCKCSPDPLATILSSSMQTSVKDCPMIHGDSSFLIVSISGSSGICLSVCADSVICPSRVVSSAGLRIGTQQRHAGCPWWLSLVEGGHDLATKTISIEDTCLDAPRVDYAVTDVHVSSHHRFGFFRSVEPHYGNIGM